MRAFVAVRCGAMDNVDFYQTPMNGLREGDAVIVRTERGLEWGETVSTVQQYEETDTRLPKVRGEVVRKATEQDLQRHQELAEVVEKEEFQFCRSLIENYQLPMKLVSVEHLFGGNKTIFFFLAEGRVDFRALVKDLAHQYRTRIEMKQIGVRDEARLLGRFGLCGRELCCRTFLKTLKPIPMKVAKSQKSTLDPAKISGRCGRLKCCLNFEDELYDQLRKSLPRRGSVVKTPRGEGVVVEQELMDQALVVRLADGKQARFPAREVEVVGGAGGLSAPSGEPAARSSAADAGGGAPAEDPTVSS